jgi:chromosome partitioning protein
MAQPYVIALASIKGGVGKTTTAICLATEWHQRGRTVAVLDADPNKPLAEWFEKATFPRIRCETADAESIIRQIREVGEGRDFVIVDLQGANNDAMIFAFGRANLVIVPIQASNFDVKSAIRTADLIERSSEMIGRPIDYRVLMTKTPPALRMRVATHSREQFEKRGLKVLSVELQERVALREMTYTREPPNVTMPMTTAARNIQALTDEIEVALGLTPARAAPAETRDDSDSAAAE